MVFEVTETTKNQGRSFFERLAFFSPEKSRTGVFASFPAFAALAAVAALAALALAPSPAFAAIGAAVTLDVNAPTAIYPGQSTKLKLTLSNSNSGSALSSVGFASTLGGTLPNGLKVAGPVEYECTDPNTRAVTPGLGVVTAENGTQAISLSGGVIPAASPTQQGQCTLLIPVTAGASTTNAAVYSYSIAHDQVTGFDGTPQANSGDVSQSVNVLRAILPTIQMTASNTTLVIGGASSTVTVTINNPNPFPLPGFGISNVFPSVPGIATPLIRVADAPNATSTCTSTGTRASFSPQPGAFSVNAADGVVAANSSCTVKFDVQGNSSGTAFSASAVNQINAITGFINSIGLPAQLNAQVTLTVRSPLQLALSFAHASLASGEADNMTVRLTNSGNVPLTITSFTNDAIDGSAPGNLSTSGLKVASVATTCSGSTASVTPNSTGLTLTGGVIAAGSNCTVTAKIVGISATAGIPQSFTNSIPAGAVGLTTPGIVSESKQAAILVADSISVAKAQSFTPFVPGSPGGYTLTFTNYSASDQSNVTVTDDLKNGMTFLTGIVNGVDYTPTITGTGCVGVSTPSAVGASRAVIAIDTIPARTNPNAPASCVVKFSVLVPVTATGSMTNAIAQGGVCVAGVCTTQAVAQISTTTDTAVLAATANFASAGPFLEGTVVRLNYTLTNKSNNALSGVSIANTLPTAGAAGQLSIAPNPNIASTCGGTIVAAPGATSLALNNGTIAARAANGTGANGTCTLSVDVIGSAGAYANQAQVAGTQTLADSASTQRLIPTLTTAISRVTFLSSLGATMSFTPPTIAPGGRSTVTITVVNSGTEALTGLAISNPLSGTMRVASPSNASTTCGNLPTLAATPGSAAASMANASLAAATNCVFTFDVTATGTATITNTIPVGNITATGGIRNLTAVSSALTLSGSTNLSVAKATNPSTLDSPGQISRLTLTISDGTHNVNGLSLIDYFTVDGQPNSASNGMVIASNPAASTTCAGGVVTAIAGASSVSLTGGSLNASASCTVTVNITSQVAGGVTNFIPVGSIKTDEGLTNAGQASTSLTTQSNIGVSTQFTPRVVRPGDISRLQLKFSNSTPNEITAISLIDLLPAGVTAVSGDGLAPTTTCEPAVLTSPSFDRLSVQGGRLAAATGNVATTCVAEFNVITSVPGDFTNTIPAQLLSAISLGNAVHNNQPASDTLRVKTALVVNIAIESFTNDASNISGFTVGSATVAPLAPVTMSINIRNPNTTPVTQTTFIESLPDGVVVASPSVTSSSCGGNVVATAASHDFRLTNATIGANSNCLIQVKVTAASAGTYTGSIAANAVTTLEGIVNDAATSASVKVASALTLALSYAPPEIPAGGVSHLTVFIGNVNDATATLTSPLTVNLPNSPGPLLVAPAARSGANMCAGTVTATAGASSFRLEPGATIPKNGCNIYVDVTATTSGAYTTTAPVGALVTSLGSNTAASTALLTVTRKGFISGQIFLDQKLVPDGMFNATTDTPVSSATVELRSGASCASPLAVMTGLVNPATTDAQGNYDFSNLNAGTYSVCPFNPTTDTVKTLVTAGAILPHNGSTGIAGTPSQPLVLPATVTGIVLNGNGAAGDVSGSSGNNFARVAGSSISGSVFIDKTVNNIRDATDPGIARVGVQLLDATDKVLFEVQTDAQGNFVFGSLLPGTYSLRIPVSAPGTVSAGTVPGAVSNGAAGTGTAPNQSPSRINGIVIGPNVVSSGNLFVKLIDSRTISGLVYFDYVATGGPLSANHGISGQQLILTGTDLQGNAYSDTTTTASDGTYNFFNVPEGSAYRVTQGAQPASTNNGVTTAGSTGGVASAIGTTPSFISGISLSGVNINSTGNNFAEIPVSSPDLKISMVHLPDALAEGMTDAVYLITPGNDANIATVGPITIVDPLPQGVKFVSGSGTGWSCSAVAQVVTCTGNIVLAPHSNGPALSLKVAIGRTEPLLINSATISGGGESPDFAGNNTAVDVATLKGGAGLQGSVWHDLSHDRIRDSNEPGVPGWHAELLRNGEMVADSITDASGRFSMSNIVPGSGYQLRFREPDGGKVFGRAVPNERGTAFTSGTTSASNPSGSTAQAGTLIDLTLVAGETLTEHSLPLDPSGIVYNSITRAPVAGAEVTLAGPTGFNPATDTVGASATTVTGRGGEYQFLLNPGAPSGIYTLAMTSYPSGYVASESALIPPCTATLSVSSSPAPALIQSSSNPPSAAASNQAPASCASNTSALTATAQATTQYYRSFFLDVATSADVLNNHIAIDPLDANLIAVTKAGSASTVELGDSLQYTVRVINKTPLALAGVRLVDSLPAGFRYLAGSSVLNGVKIADPAGSPGPRLNYTIDVLPGNASVTLTYRTRAAVGSMQGTGINHAQAFWKTFNSNIAEWKVKVTGGVFTNEACIAGKVFVDCNGNALKDEDDPREQGIPGVRLYFNDGTFLVSDAEGNYSMCNLAPRTGTLRLDELTMPPGSKLVSSGNRNIEQPNSLLLDLHMGELHRADFVEGSCSDSVLADVAARKSNLQSIRSAATSALSTELRPMIATGLVEGVIRLNNINSLALAQPRSSDVFEQEIAKFSHQFNDGKASTALRSTFFLKGTVKGDYLLTMSYDSDKDTQTKLMRDIDPNQMYPVYGDSSLIGFDARSVSKLYLRVDHGRDYLLYGDFNTAATASGMASKMLSARQLGRFSRTVTGLTYHDESDVHSFNVQASRDTLRQVIDEFAALGISGPYSVSYNNASPNSERVDVLVRDREQPARILRVTPLIRFVDYTFEPFAGRILLTTPLASFDADLNPQSIRITYEVDQGGPAFWLLAADGQRKLDEHLQVGASAVRDHNPLSPYKLDSANVGFRFSPDTDFVIEAARTTSIVSIASSAALTNLAESQGGNAGRVEFKHNGADWRVKGTAVHTDAAFNNPASSVAGGRNDANLRAESDIDETTHVYADLLRSKNALTGGQRGIDKIGVQRKLSDQLSIDASLRNSTEQFHGFSAGDVNPLLSGAPAAQTNSASNSQTGGFFGNGVDAIDPATGQSASTLMSNTNSIPNATTAAAEPLPTSLATTSARLAALYRVDENWNLRADIEKSVAGDSLARAGAGVEYRIAAGTRAYVRGEMQRGLASLQTIDASSRSNQVFGGVETAYSETGTVFSEVRLRDALTTTDAQLASGVRQNFDIAPGLKILTTAERLQVLKGRTQPATALTGAAQWSPEKSWQINGRLEFRRVEPSLTAVGSDAWLSTLTVARQLTRDWTLLGRNYLLLNSPTSGGSAMQDRTQLGAAFRDNESNRVNALALYEYKVENDETRLPRSMRRAHVVSAHVDTVPAPKWWLTTRGAAKVVNEDMTAVVSNYKAYLLGFRLSYDLDPKWTVGGAANALYSPQGNATQWARGLEAGYNVQSGLMLAVGFNWSGFSDRDMGDSDYTQRGIYLRLRWKFDETVFDRKESTRSSFTSSSTFNANSSPTSINGKP